MVVRLEHPGEAGKAVLRQRVQGTRKVYRDKRMSKGGVVVWFIIITVYLVVGSCLLER